MGRKRLGVLWGSVFIGGSLSLKAFLGERLSEELSSLEECKEKKMHVFSFGVNTSTHCD